HIFRDEIEPLHGEVETAALRIFEQEEIALAAVHRHGLEAVVSADAMRFVHHEVVGLEVSEGGDGLAALEDGAAEPPTSRPEDVLLGKHDHAEGGKLEACPAVAGDHCEAFTAPQGGTGPGLEIVLAENALEPPTLLVVVHHEPHGEALDSPLADG